MRFLLDRFAGARDRVAFVDDGRSVTYGELVDRVGDYSALLEREGVRRGDVVVAVADYSPEMFCFVLALALNGNVLAPLTHESVVERDAVMEIAEAGWFVEFRPRIEEIRFEATGRAAPEAELTRRLTESGRPGLLLFSSGSTGRPKGILHDFERVSSKFAEPRKAVVAITFLMLDHFGGINTLLAITSSLGTVVTVRDRSVASICRTIDEHRVELLPTTPSFLNMLVRSGAHERFDLGSLRTITYGTEVMPEPTLERLRAIFPGVKLQQTYGLSEVGVLRSKSRDDGSLWVRIGGEGFETRVVDGILWIKSDYAMLGYLNAPPPFDAEGWFCTEDRVEVDGEWMRILGRVTDLMNIGGQKVYPAEVEDAILSLPGIEDVAVYTEDSALLGKMIVAAVVPSSPDESVASLKKRIRLACAEKLAPFKVPSKVVLAEQSLYSARLKKVRGAKAA
jgi:acyl-CoA synthetase (AMP-forming)/AMP-acid ligase II